MSDNSPACSTKFLEDLKSYDWKPNDDTVKTLIELVKQTENDENIDIDSDNDCSASNKLEEQLNAIQSQLSINYSELYLILLYMFSNSNPNKNYPKPIRIKCGELIVNQKGKIIEYIKYNFAIESFLTKTLTSQDIQIRELTVRVMFIMFKNIIQTILIYLCQ